jgi:hypothetical protein
MAAWTRLAASAGVAVLLLAGCTYSTQEPGLFPSPQRTTEAPTPTRDRFPPQRTNPKLPVAGERIWATGGQIPVTLRIAVHAVRRVEGATVLDWSVTPLSSDGLGFGDSLPRIELGLDRPARGNHDPAVSLLDAKAGLVYRALTHQSRRWSNHCLCTPLWALAQDLRIGETRLLQVAFPSLPAATSFVDVSMATLTPFFHVPVSPLGTAPVAGQPANLARRAETLRPLAQPIEFRNPPRSGQLQRIQVNGVRAAPGRTTLEWSPSSVTDQFANRFPEYGPPVAAPRPENIYLLNNSPASGPVLLVLAPGGVKRLTTSWVATERNDVPGYECLCTELGLWSRGLREAGGSVDLVSNYPGVPAGTRTVDIDLPGFGTFRKIPVTAVEDSAHRLRPPEPARTGLWTYLVAAPPPGWPTTDWPTDTPDPAQLVEYRSTVERVVNLPGAH